MVFSYTIFTLHEDNKTCVAPGAPERRFAYRVEPAVQINLAVAKICFPDPNETAEAVVLLKFPFHIDIF
jgi:hypothetical protein